MKGQISIEFLVYLGFVLLIGSFFMLNHFTNSRKLIKIKAEIDAENLLDKVCFEINSAVTAGKGYKREFYLEKAIDGFSNYSFYVSNYSVSLDWGDNSKSSRIITQSVNGSISKGWNTIRNMDGVIYVN